MKTTVYVIQYRFVELNGRGFNLIPGTYLDVDTEHAKDLEEIGACLILKDEANDNSTDTKSKIKNGTGSARGVGSKLKDIYQSGLDKRRRTDRDDNKISDRKSRKNNSKKTD
jgi:hypothetical protein